MKAPNRLLEIHTLYLRNMQKIKWRLIAISEIRSKKRTTSYEHTNIEFCVLQMRKILEFIAFSSLISDVDIYKEKLDKVEKMWNAEYIFKDIERIHHDFYPKAIYINPDTKEEWLERTDPYLKKEEFIVVYNKCGRYLHEASPFLTEKEIYEDFLSMKDNIFSWGQLIINLLHTHVIHLYNQKDLFYINMGSFNDDSSPTGNIFTLSED